MRACRRAGRGRHRVRGSGRSGPGGRHADSATMVLRGVAAGDGRSAALAQDGRRGCLRRHRVPRTTCARVGHGRRRRGTRLSQLATLVERAQAHRPTLRGGHRIAGWFVLGLAIVALLRIPGMARARPGARVRSDARPVGHQLPLCPVAVGTGCARGGQRGARTHGRVAGARRCAGSAGATTDVVFDKTGTLSAGGRNDGSDRARRFRQGTGAAHRLRARTRQPASAGRGLLETDIQCMLHARNVTTVAGSGSKATSTVCAGDWDRRPLPASATTTALCGSATARVRQRVSSWTKHARGSARRHRGAARAGTAGTPVQRGCRGGRRACARKLDLTEHTADRRRRPSSSTCARCNAKAAWSPWWATD